jgi:hypothetical protein
MATSTRTRDEMREYQRKRRARIKNRGLVGRRNGPASRLG